MHLSDDDRSGNRKGKGLIWALGDLHLDYKKEKPMDVFGKNWEDHEERIFDAWKERVRPEDIVLLVGDISWALKLEEGEKDLRRLETLPGTKICIKGNHDYWWSSLKKMYDLGLSDMEFLQNTGYVAAGIGICGSRGWSDIDSGGFDEKDEKIYLRELNRLRLSIEDMEAKGKEAGLTKRIAMLHYPPFSAKGSPNDFADILKEAGIDICVYGHLHSYGHKFIVEGDIEGVEYICVSSDYIDFRPVQIEV